MGRLLSYIVLILILAQIATASIFNDTLLEDPDNNLKGIETRRQNKNKKARSTSSDSNDKRSSEQDDDDQETLDEEITSDDSDTSSDDDGKKKHRKKKKNKEPVSSLERTGWRKWHRPCTKCPDDMRKKWRDPSIKWICGAYQNARRTFKSTCMMYYRNCQDGTMFTKIADHRCPNGTADGIRPYRYHFFYDYRAPLTEDSSDSTSHVTESEESSSISESELERRLPPFIFH